MSKLGTKRPRQTVDHWTDPSLLDEYTAAVEALRNIEASEERDPRMNSGRPAAEKKVKAIAKKAEGDVLVFTLEAIRRGRYAELQAEHPARDGVQLDRVFGANVDGLVDAVLSEPNAIVSVVRKGDGSAVDFGSADWSDEFAEMSKGQAERFVNAVYALNEGDLMPDFSWAASLGTKPSASR